MNHFLITRFNIKFHNWQQTKNGHQTGTDEWLDERIKLFTKYCLPSVVNQTNQNFKWLLFFDIDTPLKYKRLIQKILLPHGNFHPLFIGSQGEFLPKIKNFIKNNLNEKEKFVITTRLDNDDSIHKDFIGTIQKLSVKEGQVIDLINGFQLDVSKDMSEFRDYTHQFNPFISLVELSDNFKSVYSKMHGSWKESVNVTAYSERRLWIEVVHQKNLVNRVKILPLTQRVNVENFGLSGIPDQRSVGYIFKRNLERNLKPKVVKLKKMILGSY